ncbi:hypothetical protein PPL_11545 [Heterostelium album PN500]|uniref:Uncharacterized protein n=1 Tax=Heterostelium pallidum (strain ATCC 26659 / Pp 5 / PN500) TaxID=670386 RepID=D3BVF4_HETP5|nr:hypothetical protein PPL_11545 [Heterostelium album PN500]EFA74577.1 hypothetical protein PPL_11545 [Heterostelium album PN500]|eukprot:XP_020426711.1 hypothetical protein PPL_11545 [Heterostelium album PN500]
MGHPKIALRLIELGADIDIKNQDGFTALQLAVLSGESDVVKSLLDKDAKVSTENTSEAGSILHTAYGIKEKDLPIIDSLIKKYPQLLATRDANEMTPLHIACAYGNTAYARQLIKLGADVNAVAAGGCTPLHICVDSENLEVIKDLIGSGAVLKLDETGETPLLMAKNNKKKTIEELLTNLKLDPTPYKPVVTNKSKSSSKPKVSAEDLKENGNRAFRKGDYDVALNWYQLAADVDEVSREMDPSTKNKEQIQYILFSNKAACHISLKNYTEALKDAEKTIELAPEWPKGYLRKSQALEGLGRKEEAQEATTKMNVLNELEQSKQQK